MVTATPSRAAAMLPALRPTFQPISATNSTFGPGAACASAIDWLNWAWVSQWCCSTR